jgi:hypothetical protein
MCGFGLKTGFQFTPKATGTLYVTITGLLSSNTTGGAILSLRFGTGTAPSPNAVVAGTNAGIPLSYAPVGAGALNHFTLGVRISGLTLNTAVWIDLSLTPGAASALALLSNVNSVIMEDY